MKKNQKEWRAFEQLVQRIEAVLLPQGATIESPAKITDADGTSREVDVVIAHRVGTSDIRIGLECRKRRSRADKTWIEQLSGKRQSLGLNHIIAVSRTGFSRTAIKAAQRFHVDLRSVRELRTDEIATWLNLQQVSMNNVLWEPEGAWIVFCEDEAATGEKMRRLTADYRRWRFSGVVGDRQLAADEAVRILVAPHTRLLNIRDRAEHRAELKIGLAGRGIRVHCDQLVAGVEEVRVRVRYWGVDGPASLRSAAAYSVPDKSGLQHVELSAGALGNIDIAISLTRDESSGRISLGLLAREVPDQE